MNETDWVPGLVVLGVAAAIGVGLALRSKQGAPLPPVTVTRQGELLRQKEALFQLLRDHEAAREGTEPHAWAEEKRRLETEAAAVLRELDQLGGAAAASPAGAPSAAPSAAPAPSMGARGQQLVGALWGAGAVLFLGGLFWFVSEEAKPRPEGGSVTGGTAAMGGGGGGAMGGGSAGKASAPAMPQPEMTAEEAAQIEKLKAEVAANPSDLNAKNRLAHALLEVNAVMEAFQVSDEVVKADPNNVEARTHQAMVLIGIGDLNIASKVLDKVLEGSPDYPEALLWRGMVHLQNGEREQAVARWEAASKADPGMAQGLAPLIAKAQQPTAAGEGGSGSLPSGHPPVTALDPGASASAGAAQAVSGGNPMNQEGAPAPEDITGTIQDGSGGVKAGDTLFVMARADGVSGGPPTWVKKVTVTRLPMPFRIGPANAMMPGTTPAKLVVTARVDRDGNMKSSSGDAEGKTPALAPGARDVTIALAQVP